MTTQTELDLLEATDSLIDKQTEVVKALSARIEELEKENELLKTENQTLKQEKVSDDFIKTLRANYENRSI